MRCSRLSCVPNAYGSSKPAYDPSKSNANAIFTYWKILVLMSFLALHPSPALCVSGHDLGRVQLFGQQLFRLLAECRLVARAPCYFVVAAVPCPFQVVIFVKSVSRANVLNGLLNECNFPSVCIHRGMDQVGVSAGCRPTNSVGLS